MSRHLIVSAVIYALSMITSPSLAQTVGETVSTITAPFAEEGDFFGSAIDANDEYIVVGAFGSDRYGTRSGAAYVYDADTGQFLHELVAFDMQEFMEFGFAVSIHGDRVLIGAPRLRTSSFTRGAAYVFDLPTGQQVGNFTWNNGSEFGANVELTDSVAFILLGDDEAASDSSIIAMDLGGTGLLARLRPIETDSFDGFGRAMEATEDRLYIGRTGGNQIEPAVIVYDLDTFAEIDRFTPDPSDASEAFDFGSALAINDEVILVGASNDRGFGPRCGAAYVFDRDTHQQIAKLAPADGITGDSTGGTVAIAGNYYVVGSRALRTNGAAYLYSKSSDVQTARLSDADYPRISHYSRALASNSSSLFVGTFLGEAVFVVDPVGDACVGDCDNSRTVDFNDLVNLLSRFGSPLPPSATCDADADRIIAFGDLVSTLSFFGPCP